jgi:hypothetical protein
VTEDVLVAALKTNDDLYSRAGKPTVLGDVVCYQGFAVASVSPPGGQKSHILFGFDAGSQAWRALNIGSANYCTGYVPADISGHLPGCAA